MEEELKAVRILLEQRTNELSEVLEILSDESKEQLLYVSTRLLAGVYAGRQADVDRLNHDTIATNAVNAADNLIKEVAKKCSETIKKEL